jgi:hypothetical protein
MSKYTEEFVTAAKIKAWNSAESITMEVTKNPTKQEIKQRILAEARAIMDPKFNLYFESYDKPTHSRVAHSPLQEILIEQGLLNRDFQYYRAIPEHGIALQRYLKTYELYIGESVDSVKVYDPDVIKFINKANQVIKPWVIYPEKISTKDNPRVHDLSFSTFKESFYGAEKALGITVEIRKNPTSEEAKRYVATGARGYVDREGNLYLEGYDEPNQKSKAIHNAILSIIQLVDNRIFPHNYVHNYNDYGEHVREYGVTVQRVGNSYEIRVGESAHADLEQVADLFAIAAEKNPPWKFIPEHIFDTPDYEDFSDLKIDYDDLDEDLNIVPTKDYHINNEPIRTEPDDEVTIGDGILTVKRNGEVSTQLPTDKIEHIYFEDLYEIFPYKEWDKKAFIEKTKEWTFFGDRNGGVALKGNRIVSIFGHSRSVALGFKKIARKKKGEPIFGKFKEEKIIRYLEQQGYISCPRTIFPGGIVANYAFYKKLSESQQKSQISPLGLKALTLILESR